MYLITGANLHGQWLKKEPVLNGFQAIPPNRNDCDFDYDDLKLTNISWSYNLFQAANKFYLSGSWHGNLKQLIEVPIPKEISNVKETDMLLIGNDYSLFWFDINQHIMWVMALENQASLKKVNLNTVNNLQNEKKRLRNYDPIIKVCLSNLNCLCLTACGTVYSGVLPHPLETNMCLGKVCDIQCGYEHSLLLTDSGQVYSWGNGRKLQLGHGNLNDVETPMLVEALAGINIIKISAGGWHSLALSEFGDVYTWGWNAMGQCGTSNIDKHSEKLTTYKSAVNSDGLPTLIDIIDKNGDVVNTNVINIACGTQHSAILLQDNSVWTTGCNKYGQTGFAAENTEKLLSFKKSFQCSGTTTIHCGPWATVIDTSKCY